MPLSAEEWRWMWLQGLWEGLGRELGARIRPEDIQLDQDERIRLRGPELVKMYMRLYKLREMLLITRYETPKDMKRDLELEGIRVIGDVRFDRGRLGDAAKLRGAGGGRHYIKGGWRGLSGRSRDLLERIPRS
jgi:hypothetical protein